MRPSGLGNMERQVIRGQMATGETEASGKGSGKQGSAARPWDTPEGLGLLLRGAGFPLLMGLMTPLLSSASALWLPNWENREEASSGF